MQHPPTQRFSYTTVNTRQGSQSEGPSLSKAFPPGGREGYSVFMLCAGVYGLCYLVLGPAESTAWDIDYNVTQPAIITAAFENSN